MRVKYQLIHQDKTTGARYGKAIFLDEAAASGFAGSFSKYHSLLRSQIAAPVRKFCDCDFAAEFAAEALLTWSMAGKPFEEIYGILEKILKSAVS